MARFYGTVQGERGEASRIGRKSIKSEARGWNAGVTVVGAPQSPPVGRVASDEFTVYLTHGSSNNETGFRLGELVQAPSGKRFFHLSDRAIEAIKLGTNVIALDD
jgi:hypothetical protein